MSYATKNKGIKYLDKEKKLKRVKPLQRLKKDWWVRELDRSLTDKKEEVKN